MLSILEWLSYAAPHAPFLNLSTRKVGGIRFLKIGRLTLSFSISRSYRPLKKF
jgi:hypothetical protein